MYISSFRPMWMILPHKIGVCFSGFRPMFFWFQTYVFLISDLCFSGFRLMFFWFQTYVNDQKIHDQEYVTLDHMDTIRLGNDILLLITSAALLVLRQARDSNITYWSDLFSTAAWSHWWYGDPPYIASRHSNTLAIYSFVWGEYEAWWIYMGGGIFGIFLLYYFYM